MVCIFVRVYDWIVCEEIKRSYIYYLKVEVLLAPYLIANAIHYAEKCY